MTDHICQLRESSHTYLYTSLSMSTNVWSSLACETMCGRGHEYVSGKIPLYAFVYGTRFGFVARAEPYDQGVELRSLIQTSKKKAHVVLEVVSLRPSCYGVVHASAALLQGPDYSSPQGGARYSAKFCTSTKLISFTAIPSSKAMISVVPVKVGEQNHFLLWSKKSVFVAS